MYHYCVMCIGRPWPLSNYPSSVLKLAQHSMLNWAPLRMAYGVFWGSDLYIWAFVVSDAHSTKEQRDPWITRSAHSSLVDKKQESLFWEQGWVGGWKILRQSLAMWPRLPLNSQHFSCLILPRAETQGHMNRHGQQNLLHPRKKTDPLYLFQRGWGKIKEETVRSACHSQKVTMHLQVGGHRIML